MNEEECQSPANSRADTLQNQKITSSAGSGAARVREDKARTSPIFRRPLAEQPEVALAASLAAGQRSLVAFRSLLLSSAADVEPMPAHHRWSDVILGGKKHFCVEAFRESGKTQIALRANLMHALTFPRQDRSFIVILRANFALASQLLKEISREWQARPELRLQASGDPFIIEDSGTALEVRYPEGAPVRGVRIAAFGKGGSIRGLSWGARRPDLIVCDDLQDTDDMASEAVCESDWRWFLSDVYFLGRDSRIFLIGNNLGERCIVERVIRDADAWGFAWERLPALNAEGRSAWPARFPAEELLKERDAFARAGRADIWAREKLCIARPPEAQRFRRDMFRYYDPRTLRRDTLSVYMTVDLASSKANGGRLLGVLRDGRQWRGALDGARLLVRQGNTGRAHERHLPNGREVAAAVGRH